MALLSQQDYHVWVNIIISRVQVANMVFAKYNCTLFAVEIVDKEVSDLFFFAMFGGENLYFSLYPGKNESKNGCI